MLPHSPVMPDSDRASLPLQIAGHKIAGQAGNDERVPAMTIAKTITSTRSFSCPALSSPSCPFLFLVMPDPDRAPNIFMPNYRKNRRQITENWNN